MNIEIDKSYKYIAYLDYTDQLIGGPYEIIYSSDTNKSFLASMYAKNIDESVIVPDQMIYGSLTASEISVLSKVGCMQFDLVNEFDKRYEYKSLLDTIMLTVIDLPSNVGSIILGETLDQFNNTQASYLDSITNSGLKRIYLGSEMAGEVDTTELRRLLMITQSPNTVENLSAEIHNQSLDPHYNTRDLVLFRNDMNSYLETELVVDGVDIQSNTTLGTELSDYDMDLCTEYIKAIWDNTDRKYMCIINEEVL